MGRVSDRSAARPDDAVGANGSHRRVVPIRRDRDESPTAFFAQFGVPAGEVLPDLEAFWKTIPNGGGTRPRYGPHILTGPVYIEGAAPGDTLEIQILDINPRVPYGVNNTSPMGGVLGTAYPGFRPGDVGLPTIPASGTVPGVRQHLYRIAKVRGRDVFAVSDTIHVPLAPFMGTMGVAPATGVFVDSHPTDPNVLGVQSSWPPGPFGGNMDLKDLTAGPRSSSRFSSTARSSTRETVIRPRAMVR